jgi:hypothetical protein
LRQRSRSEIDQETPMPADARLPSYAKTIELPSANESDVGCSTACAFRILQELLINVHGCLHTYNSAISAWLNPTDALDKVFAVEYTRMMSFGKNPHPAKAEAEEQKAHNAGDARAREQAWREAARQWDRAADKEKDSGRKAT